MNQISTISGEQMQTEKPIPISQKIEKGLVTRKAEFEKALPAHITFEKFQRTVMTAIVANPELTQADLGSLFLSAMKAATDGLLPDGREAAFVIFNTKIKEGGQDRWIKKVQYLPMWFGLLKKIRQSEEVESVRAHVVYEADMRLGKFEYVLGDEEKIIHEPYMGTEPKGNIIAAYCIAKLTNGDVIREVMTFAEIEKVRRTSKSGNKDGEPIGIWKEWYPEMARKTVFRRAAKWLPQSSELIDRVFANDSSMDVIENMGPAERMDSNPKAIADQSTIADNIPMIENNPDIEMPTDQPDLTAKVEAAQKQKQEEKKETPKTSQAEDPKIEKMVKGVERAIAAEETEKGLDEIFNLDFKDDFEFLKKNAPQQFQYLIDQLELRREQLLGNATA